MHRYQKCFPLRDKHQNYWLKIVRGKWFKVKIANQQNQLISPFWAFIISKRLLIIGPIVTAGRLATVSQKNPECFWLNKTQPDTLYSSRLIRQSRCADLKEIKLIVITALKHSTNYLFRWYTFYSLSLSLSSLLFLACLGFHFQNTAHNSLSCIDLSTFNTFEANQSIEKSATVFRLKSFVLRLIKNP